MRAGRLVSLLLLLQRRGRLSAPTIARELDVSVRTVLRDIDALSGAGVPVYAVRGRNGGFELLDGNRGELVGGEDWPLRGSGRGRARATVRVTEVGVRTATLLQVLQPLRVRAAPDDDDGRLHATFRIRSIDAAVRDVIALGAEIEVLVPPELRAAVAHRARTIAALYPER